METLEKQSANHPQQELSHEYIDNSQNNMQVYRPPGSIALFKEELSSLDPNDRSSSQYQKVSWEILRKSMHGLINRVNSANIKEIVIDLFKLNLLRGRGYFARSILKAQSFSPTFTHIYSALVAIINSKLPTIGNLLLRRIILQFRKSYQRNEKIQCSSCCIFLAHLVNVKVADEAIALQLLTLLLENPTNDSVEISVSFMKACGQHLSKNCAKSTGLVFERFKEILRKGMVEFRTQYLIEELFKVRKDRFKDFPAVTEELDLVEDEDQITHFVSLDEEIDAEEYLNDFQFNDNFVNDEQNYEEIKKEILPSEDEDEEEAHDEEQENDISSEQVQVYDNTSADLTNLRKVIYLTIMSSVEFEETVHKILKLNVPSGSETEVCTMIAECCGQERTYLKYYGLMADRLCKLSQIWALSFERAYMQLYETIHRFETNQIRNIAKLFAHLLEVDAISWSFFDCIKLTEDDTTASSRIFLKILFQDLNEFYGRADLVKKFNQRVLAEFFKGIFPRHDQQHIRFCINFFTAIGLGYLTEDMRKRLEYLMSQ